LQPENKNNNKKALLTIRALDAPSCRRRGRRAAPAAAPSPPFHPPACPGRRPARPATQLHKDLANVQKVMMLVNFKLINLVEKYKF
jgi:hypothetical protein